MCSSFCTTTTLMSALQEHDYIGLSELDAASDKLSSSDVSTDNEKNNLKETELRLGLPGLGLSLFGKDLEESEKSVGGFCASPFKNFASSGAKRGFSDAIDGSSNWGLSVKVGSEVDLSRGGVDGVLEKNGAQKLGFTGANFSPSLKVVEEKKVSVPAPKYVSFAPLSFILNPYLLKKNVNFLVSLLGWLDIKPYLLFYIVGLEVRFVSCTNILCLSGLF